MSYVKAKIHNKHENTLETVNFPNMFPYSNIENLERFELEEILEHDFVFNIDKTRFKYVHEIDNLILSYDCYSSEAQAIFDTMAEEYKDIEYSEIIEIVDFADCENMLDALEYLVDIGTSFDVLESEINNVQVYNVKSLEDLAYEFVIEGLFGDVPEDIKCYINYKSIAKSLQVDGYAEFNGKVFYLP